MQASRRAVRCTRAAALALVFLRPRTSFAKRGRPTASGSSKAVPAGRLLQDIAKPALTIFSTENLNMPGIQFRGGDKYYDSYGFIFGSSFNNSINYGLNLASNEISFLDLAGTTRLGRWSTSTNGLILEAAISGQNALSVTTNGARIKLGTGTNDYLYSDGTRIITPGDLYASGSLNSNLSMLIGGIGNANTSSILEMSSSNKGVLFPRVTGAARATITGSAGLLVYQTNKSGSDSEGLYIYKSTGWVQII